MELKTNDIWKEHYSEIFFFTLKRVGSTDAANDIIQNTFLKVHSNLNTVTQASKIKSWVFQIARNEIVNFYNSNNKTQNTAPLTLTSERQTQYDSLCCFDKFIDELPEKYKAVITLVYLDGKKLAEVAQELALSLANVKARVRRGKEMLKEKFKVCCKFDMDANGKLVGESNCIACCQI